jgi:hypothetical protein
MDQDTKTGRVIGYLLLVAGVAGISFAAISTYRVFAGLAQPFNLFSFESISVDLSKFIIQSPNETPLTQEIIPSILLNKPMNYIAHLLLMSFIASCGFKIAIIGVYLLRPVKIKIKTEEETRLGNQS